MGKFIIKLQEHYLEYSTVSDSPTTFGMKLDEFLDYYRSAYGSEGMADLSQRLARVEQKGTSARTDESVEDTVLCNHAGSGGTKLSVEEIYAAYCLQVPIRDGWTVPTVSDSQ